MAKKNKLSVIYLGGTIATAGFIDMAEAETSSSELDLPINQPHDFSFPKRQFGKSKLVYRSFQSQWFHNGNGSIMMMQL